MRRHSDQLPPHVAMMRERMEQLFTSQADLAWVVGKSASDVSLVLKGARRLTARAAVSYGAALGLSAFDLLRAQNAGLLALSPIDESKSEAIRGRVELVNARKRNDTQTELTQLRQMRDRLNTRIAELEAA